MTDEVIKCELTNSFAYKTDAFLTKTGYVSVSGKYAFYNNRYEYMAKKKIKNFMFYLFPYILSGIVLLLLTIIEYMIPGDNSKIEKVLTSISGYICIGIIINFIISTISFMKNNDLNTVISNPENTIYECSGTIDISTGTINSSTIVYDTYSGTQIFEIIGNVIKFLLFLILLVLFGWVYWIVYTIRMIDANNKAKKILNEL